MSEDATNGAPVVLATAAERWQWYAAHLTVALAGSAALLILMGVGVATTLGMQQGDVAGALGNVVPAALAQVPAVWVMAGVAAALFGVARSESTA